MSRVYRGYDENLDRYAAVKVISGDFATTTEEEYTRRFQIEARAIARLRHPNIVGVYQFGRIEGIYYMAMVFLEGRDLRTFLKEYAERGQRIPVAELLRIARDVANALDYAHEQGVIHRDIKPSNIMLEKRTGRAILMDFGLALSVHEGTTGDTFGSAHYIAPEQAISSAKAVPQSDLYALGIVLYEMMAGKVPFDDPSAMSVALKHLNEVPPPLSMYNPDLPPEVEKVIMRVLDKDPNRRYKTGAEFVDALEQAFKTATKPEAVMADVIPPPVEVPPLSPTPMVKPPASRKAVPSPSAQPAPPVPTVESEPPQRGVAGRFARRKARKDEEAALQALSEDALQIDDATLGSILDSYADPRDIGLVGPEATGIRPPSASSISRPTGMPPAVQEKKKRRSRVGILLPLILLLLLVLAAWYGTEGMKRFGGSSTPADGQTAAAMGLAESTETAAEAGTLEPEETEVAEPSEMPTATEQEVVVIPSETSQAETQEPTNTQVPEETDTPTPPPADATEAPAGQEPNIRLKYGGGQFLLINISDHVLDISQLVFEQELPDGEMLVFEADLWRRNGADPTSTFENTCFQLLTAEANQTLPSRDECRQLMGWFRSNRPDRYFWVSNRPTAKFSVYVVNQTEPLATCEIAAGECLFYLPEE